jgi:hypothetical protein
MDDNKKKFIPQLAIDIKIKGAVRAVCALLCIWPLSA